MLLVDSSWSQTCSPFCIWVFLAPGPRHVRLSGLGCQVLQPQQLVFLHNSCPEESIVSVLLACDLCLPLVYTQRCWSLLASSPQPPILLMGNVVIQRTTPCNTCTFPRSSALASPAFPLVSEISYPICVQSLCTWQESFPPPTESEVSK